MPKYNEKIGNYIHYKYDNYLKYGIQAYSDIEKKPNPRQIFRDQKKNVLKQILQKRTVKNKEKIRRELERQLNFFFNPKDEKFVNVDWQEDEIEKMQKAILDILEMSLEKLNINLSDFTINPSNLKVSLNEGANLSIEQRIAKIKKYQLGETNKKTGLEKKVTSKAVARRIDLLLEYRKNLSSSSTSNLLQQINKLEEEYNKLKEELGESYYFNNKGFVEELNKTLKKIKATSTSQVSGAVGEYIQPISQYVLNNYAGEKINDLLSILETEQGKDIVFDIISKKVVGQDRSRKTLNPTNVINQKKNKNTLEVKIGDVDFKTNYTQDKVDVILDLPQNEKINATVKNYDFSIDKNKDVTLLKGRSLLELLQDYHIFTNHYLNITAIGKGSRSENLLQNAHNTMKLTAALHAMAGGVWAINNKNQMIKTDMAEIFVINDSSIGKFSVHFLSDIMELISNNYDLIKMEGLDPLKTWNNEWVGEKDESIMNRQDAYKRIANILAELHRQKLKISISKEAFNK